MSRIGKKEIKFDASVKPELKDNILNFKGAKGNLAVKIPEGLTVKIESGTIQLAVSAQKKDLPKNLLRIQEKQNISNWGTVRQLISNSVEGITTGFSKVLIMEGVGYRASVAGTKLTLIVGYSHPIEMPLPAGITAKVDNNTKITISGADKQLIGKVAAEIRLTRPPEPYKGKGIRYEGEFIRRKAGKTGKK